MPDERPPSEADRWYPEEVGLERRRVDDVDVELTQPSGQTSDEGGGPHRRARRRAPPRCLLTSGRADALVEQQHLDRMPALAQPTDQGAVGEEDDSRVDVVTLGEGVHEAHERQLHPAELRRVVEDRHAHRSLLLPHAVESMDRSAYVRGALQPVARRSSHPGARPYRRVPHEPTAAAAIKPRRAASLHSRRRRCCVTAGTT